MSSLASTLLLAGFFFIMGAAVIGIIWYLQSVSSGNFRRGKGAGQSEANLAEVARLMRDKTTQDLIVAMNGHIMHNASELNPGQARRLTFASSVLVKWLADAPVTLLTAEDQPASAAETTPKIGEWIPADTGPQDAHHEYIPPFVVEPEPEVKPVSTDFSDVVGGIIKPASSTSSATEFKSIAQQIDQILQEMIANTPFEERGITVNDAPDHGVMVTLDGKEYPGVKDVPDEEVRNLIRSAVVEWEKTGKFGAR